MPPPLTQAFGIDTSIFVRLLTGHPKVDFERTSKAIEDLLGREPTAELSVSNQVIGESYITLQFHYGVSKADAREAIHKLLVSGVVSPLNGQPVLEMLKDSTGAGLVDRLIAQDYEANGYRTLTNDKKMSKLSSCELLS